MTGANNHLTARGPAELSEEWYSDYERELFDEDGDPDALLASYREVSEQSLPGSPSRAAFTLLMERLLAEHFDLEPVDAEAV